MSAKPPIPASPSEEYYRVDEDQGDVFTHDDPWLMFADWMALATKAEPNDPNAMALATVDAHGLPDVRIVLLKDADARGLTFYTNTQSAKGDQILANPKAALAFHWKTIRRQVRFRGGIAPVSAAEADAYFATRARGAQIGAWGSDQSRPMANKGDVKTAVAEMEKKFEGRDVPRPPHWSGYRLEPQSIEFWVNRPYRLHDRLRFESDGDGWRTARLYP
jgi:pyridoxamine 5'-phosphate oxidase